jgi:hypothetical protein
MDGQLLQLTWSCKKPKTNVLNRLWWDTETEKDKVPKKKKDTKNWKKMGLHSIPALFQ